MMVNTVDIECYLAVGVTFKRYAWGDKPSIRLTMNKPALAPHEVSILLTIKLPTAIFQKPSLSATIAVSDAQPLQSVITPDVQDNIAQVLRDQLGMSITITAEPPKDA